MRALSRFWLTNLRWKILIYLSFTLQKESSIIFFFPMFSLHRKTTRGRPFRKFVIISGLELFPDCTCYLVFISLSSLIFNCCFAGLSCITFSWRDSYIRLIGLKKGLLTHEVWQLVQWWALSLLCHKWQSSIYYMWNTSILVDSPGKPFFLFLFLFAFFIIDWRWEWFCTSWLCT